MVHEVPWRQGLLDQERSQGDDEFCADIKSRSASEFTAYVDNVMLKADEL